MSSIDAYNKAIEYNLDLVCISPDTKPPICKILDYGKYRFEIQKKNRKNRYKQNKNIVETKTIQLTPQIQQHDFLTKVNNATKFLKKGDKVKILMRFKGRQLIHVDFGIKILNDFIFKLSDISVIEKPVFFENKIALAIIASKFKKNGEKYLNEKNEN